ncbi:hypothetical protein ACE193_18285 [Bernardetia sp. OM2101]|uniref:hypothetical protein n=1 Tax=Bernardetia sp. OM2101 TaxID=3344876 RepID=UPI0035CEE46A
MGVIKNISDEVIINNESELITPAIVRQVNDVIDAQVEAAKTSISTLEQNITTLNSGTIPNGGTTGQVLSKKTNTDKDVHWIDSAGGGNATGDYLPLSGGTMQGNIDGGSVETIAFDDNIIATYKPTLDFENAEVKGFSVNYARQIQGIPQFLKNGTQATKRIDLIQGRAYLISQFNISQDGILDLETGHYRNFQKKPLKYIKFNIEDSLPSIVEDGDIPHKAYVDNAIQKAGSGNYLPLTGGIMTGDIDMSGGYISRVNGISTNDETQDAVAINLQQRFFYCPNGIPFSYHSDYSANFTARSLVDKKYVDAQKPKKFKQTFGATGADPIEQLVTHNLGTTEVLAIVRTTEGFIEVYYPHLKSVTPNSFIFTRQADASSTEITVVTFTD